MLSEEEKRTGEYLFELPDNFNWFEFVFLNCLESGGLAFQWEDNGTIILLHYIVLL